MNCGRAGNLVLGCRHISAKNEFIVQLLFYFFGTFHVLELVIPPDEKFEFLFQGYISHDDMAGSNHRPGVEQIVPGFICLKIVLKRLFSHHR